MIGPDDCLSKLFNVCLGSYRFHWCCFVLKKQIILAMWCNSVPRRGQPKVLPLVDNALKHFTTSIEFRRMVFYLSRWFTAQYVSPTDRQLKVVLDCKPSESFTLVHIIALLAYRSGMDNVIPQLSQQRVKHDMNYHFNLRHANTMLTCPSDDNARGNYINIVEEFNDYYNSGAIGLTCICTTMEYYSFL